MHPRTADIYCHFPNLTDFGGGEGIEFDSAHEDGQWVDIDAYCSSIGLRRANHDRPCASKGVKYPMTKIKSIK
jgi:hypothetical protein